MNHSKIKKKHRLMPFNLQMIFFSAAASLFMPFFHNTVSAAGNPGAVQAVADSEDTITGLQMAAKTIKDKKQNELFLQEAQKDLQQTKQDIQNTREQLKSNQLDLQQAAADLEAIEKALQTAEANEQLSQNIFWQSYAKAVPAAQEASALENQLAQYQASYDAAAAQEAALDTKTTKTSSTLPSLIEEKLKEYNYDENFIEIINDEVSRAEDDSAQEDPTVEQRLEAAAAETEQARSVLDEAQSRLDSLQEIIADSDNAKLDWEEAKKDLLEQRKDAQQQKTYVEQLRQDGQKLAVYSSEYEKNKLQLQNGIEALQKELSPYQNYSSVQDTNEFYFWQAKNGSKGRQYISTTSYSMAHDKLELGISTGRVKSNNKSSGGGGMSGLLDTQVHLGLRNFQKVNQVTYNLDVNLPTGKNNLHSTTAMSTDLVPYDKLGSGWQFIPSVQVKHAVNDVDFLLYGGGINFSGSYNYNNMNVNPGTELTGNVGWLHAAPAEQFMTTIFLNKSDDSQDGTLAYKNGRTIQWRSTYNKQIGKTYEWPSYLWFSYSAGTKYRDFPTAGGQTRIFGGTGLQKIISQEEKLSLMMHFMHSRGSDYDPVTQLAVSDRNKYTLRLSYDKIINNKSSWSVALENFYMKDGGSSGTSYKGMDLMFNYNRNF